ncbi:MAG TPA: hypothetical protein VGI81_22885 [Tepidisphaeraceae bacterium]
MRIADSRPVRLAVAFLLVVSLSGAVPSAAAAAAANANPPPPNASAELALRAYAILDEQAHRPGADPSDIAYMAGKLGFDANRIFVFVRDETRLEPYRGVLRGARGVLAGRAGNSLDRALLLQAQLTESGVPCRLMQGKLPDATARQALDQFLNAPQAAPPPPPAGDDSDPGATKLLQRAGVPDSLAAEIRDRCTAHSAAFWRSVSSQSDERAAYLAGQLTAAGLKPPKADAIQKELLDSLKTHYWVQRQDAEGKWIDLDPLLTSLQPGQTAGQDGKPAGAIAASLRHQLDFSLIYRTKQGNGGKEEVVLKRTVDAADAPFKPMAFAVQSADTDLPAPFNMTNQQKVDLVRRMKKFQGIFRAGSEMTAGRPFDLKGNTYDVQPGGVIGNASGVGQATGGAFGGFGGALGGGGPKPPANTFVDLRVVMTLRSPGRQPITQTRVLTTAADPVAPLLNWELFLQPAFSPDKLMEYQFTDYLARQRPYVEAILAPKPGAVPIPNNWPFPIYAASISMLRNAALRRTLGSESGVVPLMDHPNLFMTSHSVRVNAAGTGTEGRWGVDLVEMGLNFVPKAAANESTALNLALRQSVAERPSSRSSWPTRFRQTHSRRRRHGSIWPGRPAQRPR